MANETVSPVQAADRQLSSAIGTMNHAADELYQVARVLFAVNSDRLAETVRAVAGELREQAKATSEAAGRIAYEYVRQSEEGSVNMLKAALAGITLAHRGEEPTP